MSQPGPSPQGLVPAYSLPPRRRTSPLTVVTMVVLGLGSLLIALLLLVSGGPTDAIVTTFLAALSFPLLIALCFWLDRYEPEPLRYRIAALGWGAIVAVGIALLMQVLVMAGGASPESTTVIWAPVTEEFAKGLFPFLVLMLRRAQLHGILDGIVYAVLVGIGFAFTEDIVYYLQSLSQGGPGGLAATFFLRGVLSPFAHPLFTSATGVGIGIAVMSRSRAVQIIAPLLGYLVAVLLHAIWNGSATFGGTQGFFVTYLLAFLPLLLVLVLVAIWARRQEGRMLTGALEDCARMGWVGLGEIRWVARLSDRVAARRFARSVGGKQAADVLADYQQTLTEMAFLHNRVVSGTAPADFNHRMYAIQQRAAMLRPGVILPPWQPQHGPVGGPGQSGPGLPAGPSQWSPIPGQAPAHQLPIPPGGQVPPPPGQPGTWPPPQQPRL